MQFFCIDVNRIQHKTEAFFIFPVPESEYGPIDKHWYQIWTKSDRDSCRFICHRCGEDTVSKDNRSTATGKEMTHSSSVLLPLQLIADVIQERWVGVGVSPDNICQKHISVRKKIWSCSICVPNKLEHDLSRSCCGCVWMAAKISRQRGC